MENYITEVSSKSPKKILKGFQLFKANGFKSLGLIVKIISFVVAISVLLGFIVAAYLLFAFKPIFITASIAIILLGLVISLISLFLIYALGHCIDQNNEILKLLKK